MRKAGKRVIVTLGLALIGGSAALLVYGWPFLTYPVTRLEISSPAPLPSPTINSAEAGVARRDITPPIGLPKFGYSTFAYDADGFRTRLWARALYLHAPGGEPMALVQADLGSGSLPLRNRIAELVAPHTDIPAHAISLLVTHTHSGPGNYLGSDFYNVFGSNRPGFDPKVFEFLAQQIAEAIIDAYQHRRPARIATGSSERYGLTRNRSLAAWAENTGIAEEKQTAELARHAINPTLSMMRVDLRTPSGCWYPAGALSLFSIHGTAIPAFTGPYHADVWSAMSRNMELAPPAHTCTDTRPFVHAAAQATHADNSPDIPANQRGDREAHRIGAALADTARTLFNQLNNETQDSVETAFGARQLNLLEQTEQKTFGLCERAVVGTSLVGAANGDEVFPLSYLPYFTEQWPRRVFTEGCHGVKQWMISKLQLLLPAERFPHQALFQVARINNLVLVAVPWEVTFESGNRIRSAVREALPPGDWQIEVSSLANGYFGYAVTPEEYRQQFYEGGHTLYGPNTTPFLAATSAQLAAALWQHGAVKDVPDTSVFELVTRDHWPDESGDSAREMLSQPAFVEAQGIHAAYWRIRYRDLRPADLVINRPLLSITSPGGKTLANDADSAMQLLLLSDDADSAEYEARWFPGPTSVPAAAVFRIAPRANQPALISDTFQAGAAKP